MAEHTVVNDMDTKLSGLAAKLAEILLRTEDRVYLFVISGIVAMI